MVCIPAWAIKQPTIWNNMHKQKKTKKKKAQKCLLSLSNGLEGWQVYRTEPFWLYLLYMKPWKKLQLSHFPPGSVEAGVEPCEVSPRCTNQGAHLPSQLSTEDQSGALLAISTLTRQYPFPLDVMEIMREGHVNDSQPALLRWHPSLPPGTMQTVGDTGRSSASPVPTGDCAVQSYWPRAPCIKQTWAKRQQPSNTEGRSSVDPHCHALNKWQQRGSTPHPPN